MRILDAVAEAAYLEVELVPFSLISERIPMLQKGEVDFIMDIMVSCLFMDLRVLAIWCWLHPQGRFPRRYAATSPPPLC